MIYALLAVGAAAAAYQLLALAAAVARLFQREPAGGERPGISILKPVRGVDPHFYECIRSHAEQQYPSFEILFGVADPDDPAVAEIEQLRHEYPQVAIRLIRGAEPAPNRKVGVLMELARAARYPVLVVNDSDIHVPPGYLERIAAPLEDAGVSMVTCLYRARAEGWAGRIEAVGIATDFAPSVLVAPLVGVSEFALGSTMAFRAADLAAIGGFASIREYIADDYQLSRRIRARTGGRVVLSKCVVETSVPEEGWRGMWRHQLRWARTIRLARGGGYLGLPLANATLWAALVAAAGWWTAAVALFALRMTAGLMTAAGVLGDRRTLAHAWLVPVRDAIGLAIWACGLFGSTVTWRGADLKLDREGRIQAPEHEAQPAQTAHHT